MLLYIVIMISAALYHCIGPLFVCGNCFRVMGRTLRITLIILMDVLRLLCHELAIGRGAYSKVSSSDLIKKVNRLPLQTIRNGDHADASYFSPDKIAAESIGRLGLLRLVGGSVKVELMTLT